MRHILPFLLLATSLVAQPGPGPRPLPNLQSGPLAERLFQMRMSRIQQTLGLSDERARAIATRWKQYDLEFMNGSKRMDPLREQFNQVLRCTSTEEEKSARLKPLLEQFLALRTEQERAQHRFEEELRANLSPAQQVRLILLMEDLHHELREILREAVREHRKGQR
jgi:hypothetical protein